ncbi:uncharacterized protein A4U43_C03F12190 [Asparagus officinalis]|uniref:RWP-RK domain-containing protein n=1 Tax=Asparagus officinalis TaxID=4686 RepID=A0A5P1F9Z6_ASPOF|nr:uncharacterized protein LOC109832169 [Asparagus officinalis]ONK74992.1 uncharacterized protein A4U43_C03F12190 [Asparagus officinalis]
MDCLDQFENLDWLREIEIEIGDDGGLQKCIEPVNEEIPHPLPSVDNNEEETVHANLGSQGLVASGPFDCSGCTLLREVVHTNGLETARLVIHGGLGVFYHAMLEYTVDGLPRTSEPSFMDFSALTYEQVKQLLIDYGLLRASNGYIITQDSVSSFYDALCVRVNFDVPSTSNNEYFDVPSTNNNETQLPGQGLPQSSTVVPSNELIRTENTGISAQRETTENLYVSSNVLPLPPQGLYQSSPIVASNDPIRTEKTGIAAQRERTANLHIRDFVDYFHLRIVDAAKEFGICPTALKKICRKYGMERWPYRKVKSIDNQIKKLQNDLLAQGGQEANSTQMEIERLRAQRVRACGGLRSSRL